MLTQKLQAKIVINKPKKTPRTKILPSAVRKTLSDKKQERWNDVKLVLVVVKSLQAHEEA
jgi:hypothetical protein